jgi:hypothetical protein
VARGQECGRAIWPGLQEDTGSAQIDGVRIELVSTLRVNFPRYGLWLALSTLAAFAGAYLATGSLAEMLKFNLVHFYLSYQELGFIRRGLEGSLLSLFSTRDQQWITIISYGYIFLVALCIWYWVLQQENERKSWSGRNVLFVLSPALFLHYGYDLGRSDPLLVSLQVLSLLAIQHNRHIWAVIFSALGILIHEVYFFAMLPLVCVFAWCQLPSTSLFTAISVLKYLWGIPFLVYLSILFWSGTHLSPEAAAEVMNRHLSTDAYEQYYLYATSIGWNIWSSWAAFFSSVRLHSFQLFLLVSYTSLLYAFLEAGCSPKHGLRDRWLIVSAFVPVLLVLVATDKGRWFSMVASNLLLVYAYLHGRMSESAVTRSRYLFTMVLVFGCLSGPMTVSSFAFPACFDHLLMDEGKIKWRNHSEICTYFRSFIP